MALTKLTRPLVRETEVYERTSAIIVTLHKRHVEVRLKNHSERYVLTYRAMLDIARAVAARAKIQHRS